MKLVKPSITIIPQENGLEGLYKHIEKAGRVCYASEPKNTVSSKQFVQRLIKSGHGSVLEHGTIYLFIPNNDFSIISIYNYKYSKNSYSTVNTNDNGDLYITTNLRVLVENKWLWDLKYMCNPLSYHDKRITVEVNCDIGISREFNRHKICALYQ